MGRQCRRQGVTGRAQYSSGVHKRLAIPLLLIVAMLASACGGSDADTFSEPGAPFTFDYPPELQKVFADTGRETKGLEPTYRVSLGTDETNVVVVATYDVDKDTTKIAPAKLAISVERAARALARAMQADPPQRSEAELGEMPATAFEFSASQRGLTTRLYYAFEGKTQFFVRCQWDALGEDVIPGACDEVASSFTPAGS